MRRAPVTILVVAAALVGGLAGESRAQTPLPFDELGAGPRATAMGQAFVAVADDPSAAYYNPAGLAFVPSPIHLQLGYLYAKPMVNVKFDVEPEPNPYLGTTEFSRSEDLPTRGIYVGYSSNFENVGAFEDSPFIRRFALGVSLFTNLPEVNQFDNPQRPQDPYFFKYNERWSLISLAISMSMKLTEWLSVGAGVLPRVDGLQQSTGSWLSLNGVADPNDPGRGLRLDLRQTTKINAVAVAGVLARPPLEWLADRLSIGFSYRGEMWGFYGTGITAVDVLVEVPEGDPIVIYDDPGGRTVDYIGYNPQQVTGGIAVKPIGGLTIAFDLTWKDYSAFHYFWDLPPDPPFRDVWVPRVGVAYAFDSVFAGDGVLGRIDEIRLLAGYYKEPSPVGDMSGPMNILDADQNVVSMGIGVEYDAEWTGYVAFDAYVQGHLFESRRISNDEDPLFGPVTVGGHVVNAGAAISVVY